MICNEDYDEFMMDLQEQLEYACDCYDYYEKRMAEGKPYLAALHLEAYHDHMEVFDEMMNELKGGGRAQY